MPKISIVVPVYNTEEYLDKCLHSICNQTLVDIEIIVINDGSSDQSLQIIEKYAKSDMRIKYKNQQNQGPSMARNQGIIMAKGNYIAFVDSDDWIEKEMYETMYNIAESHHLNVVMSNIINDYEDRLSTIVDFKMPDSKVLDHQEIHSLILPEFFKDTYHNTACNKIYNMKFINQIQSIMPKELNYGEDLLFLLKIFDNLTKTYFINIPFYHYIHRKNNSLTNIQHVNFVEKLCYMYNMRKRYAMKWGIPLYEVAQPFMYYILMDLINNTRKKTNLEKRRCVGSYLNSNEIKEAMVLSEFCKTDYNFKFKILFLLLKWRLISLIAFML